MVLPLFLPGLSKSFFVNVIVRSRAWCLILDVKHAPNFFLFAKANRHLRSASYTKQNRTVGPTLSGNEISCGIQRTVTENPWYNPLWCHEAGKHQEISWLFREGSAGVGIMYKIEYSDFRPRFYHKKTPKNWVFFLFF
jgi:hypothetical protein